MHRYIVCVYPNSRHTFVMCFRLQVSAWTTWLHGRESRGERTVSLMPLGDRFLHGSWSHGQASASHLTLTVEGSGTSEEAMSSSHYWSVTEAVVLVHKHARTHANTHTQRSTYTHAQSCPHAPTTTTTHSRTHIDTRTAIHQRRPDEGGWGCGVPGPTALKSAWTFSVDRSTTTLIIER